MAFTTKVKIRYKRPEKINQYPEQLAFIDAPARFTIIEATTKAGKTSGCIVWLFEQAISSYGFFHPDRSGLGVVYNVKDQIDKTGFNYWWVAPVYSVAKIAYNRLKKYLRKNKRSYRQNEAELYIELPNNARIWFKSADKPDSLYGEDVHAAVIDEGSRMKEDSWTAVLSVLTATKGACKLIGNVKGDNNWFYKAARETEQKKPGRENWKYFKITADDAVRAGVLDPVVINEARGSLPEGIFLELFYGIPFTKGSDRFAYSFEKAKHVDSCSVEPGYPIYLSFDFNKNPISVNVIQFINGEIRVPYVKQMDNSNIYTLCRWILSKFPDGDFIVNGDATGLAGSAMVQDGINYYTIIREELDLGPSQIQLTTNPTISSNQVLVNAVLEHIPVRIDPANASALVFDLEHAKMDGFGKLLKKDRNKVEQRLEALDGFRYYLNKNHGSITREYKNNY